VHHVLIDGEWRAAEGTERFRAVEPATASPIDEWYPVSARSDLERAIEAGAEAARDLAELPDEARARFLERYADLIEGAKDALVASAHRETALPASPRLADVELPRTTGQLRLAANAARSGAWAQPTIDTRNNVRSIFGPLGGPVVIFGPNNFPLAFNSISGGDFAAAIAAGNPVIAKGHPAHPTTTRLLAELAAQAVIDTGLPPASVQLVYHMAPDDGLWLVSDPRVGATAYTGSRRSGLALKAAADEAGRPIYLELGSINPVFVLPNALRERADEIAKEYVTSALMGAGQFCTNPGIVVLLATPEADAFLDAVRERFEKMPTGTLLDEGTCVRLGESVAALERSGAEVVTGGMRDDGAGFRFRNTLLRTTGARFLASPEELQREAFGPAGLFVFAGDDSEMEAIASVLEGSLTGTFYTARDDSDDVLYERLEKLVRPRVGRLLNDKMPTGVAVSPAMNHGGPFPATGHPGFTAVGIPRSLLRFAQLRSYDNVRDSRLPAALRDRNPTGELPRSIDGEWTTKDIGESS